MAACEPDCSSKKPESSEHASTMRRAFERADSDLSGKIPFDQFSTAAQAAGFEPSEEDLDAVFQRFDKDEDSGINFDEFVDMVSYLEEGNQEDYENCLRRAFKKFDRDGSGYISPEELRYVVCNTGEKFSQSEAEELIGMFDVNKDGQLSWEEFVTFAKTSIMEEEENANVEEEDANVEKGEEEKEEPNNTEKNS